MTFVNKFFQVIWQLATTPSTFVVLCLLWCLNLGLGSVNAYMIDPQFSAKMDAYPLQLWLRQAASRNIADSLWVYIFCALSYLMVLSLFLCSINWLLRRRRKLHSLGEFLVHFGFLAIFAGFVIGAIGGERKQGVLVPLNGQAQVGKTNDNIKLLNLQQTHSKDGRVLDTRSSIQLFQNGVKKTESLVRINHPLIFGPLVIYSRGSTNLISKVFLNIAGQRDIVLNNGESILLPRNNVLTVRSFLQQGERRGNAIGPGTFLDYYKPEKKSHQTIYLTNFVRQYQQVTLQDTKVQLKKFGFQQYGIYDIHRDPGIQFVLWGTIILGIGTIWSLSGYLKNSKPLLRGWLLQQKGENKI